MDDKDLRYIILTNELGDLMIDSVAPIYDKSSLTLYIFQAFGIVLSKEFDFIPDLINQMFPQTVTWGISLWEKEYGIIPDVSKTIEQRRQYLLGVMYKKTPMTPYRIKQLVYSITGQENNVLEGESPNTVTIDIYGYVPNLTELKSVLDKRLPAHLTYEISMAEVEKIETTSYSGIGVHEFETINVEVIG